METQGQGQRPRRPRKPNFALGRCEKLHVNKVEHVAGTMPAGTCTCGRPLIEWAKNPGR